MKRCGKILFVVLLVMLLIATLVACNPTGQGGGDGGSGSNTDGGDKVIGIVGLQIDATNTDCYLGEFNLGRDVKAYLLEKRIESGVTKYVRTGDPIAVTEDMLSAEDVAKLGKTGRHTITVHYTYEEKDLIGTFELHLSERPAKQVALTINFPDGTLFGIKDTYKSNVFEGSTFVWSTFISQYPVSAPDKDGRKQTVVSYSYNGGVFDSNNTIVVNSDMTLTANYGYADVAVSFNANAPADSAASVPELSVQNVAKNGFVAQPHTNDFVSEKYVLTGWEYNGVMWNFNQRVQDQVSSGVTEIELKGVWAVRTYSVKFDLMGGSLNASADYSADVSGLKEAAVSATYDTNGNISAFTLTNIEYGSSLNDYYAKIKITSSSDAVNVKLSYLDANADTYLTKGNLYLVNDLFADKDFTSSVDFAAEVKASGNVFVQWGINDAGEVGDAYYGFTFNFILKNDGTYKITLKDKTAGIIKIPATYPTEKGIPVTEIASGAFENVDTITQLDLSSATNLTKIGENAFSGCDMLTSVKGNADTLALTYVGAKAFNNTPWLIAEAAEGKTAITLGKVLVRYNGADTEVVDLSGETFEYIAPYAFDTLVNMKEVKLPATVKRIENNAFNNCSALATVTTDATGIEFIGYEAFKGTPFFNGASLGEGVKDLIVGNVYYRFLGNSSDASATVKSGVTVIADKAFRLGTGLTEITFENEGAIVSVGQNAFSATPWSKNDADGFVIVNNILANYVGKSATVVIPDNVTAISASAFESFNAAGVQNIVFRSGSAISAIADHAFMGAVNLKTLSFYKQTSDGEINVKVGDELFCNGNGAFINNVFKIYAYQSVNWNYNPPRDVQLITDDNMTAVLNDDVIPVYYMTGDDNEVDYISAWRATSSDGVNYVVANGLLVTRGDGVTITENLNFTATDISGLRENSGSAGSVAVATGEIFSFNGKKVGSFNYNIFAAIRTESFSVEGFGGDGSEGNPFKFYTSQQTIDLTKGVLRFSYTNSATEAVPLTNELISVSGYTNAVGTRTLTLRYDFYGISTYEWEMYYTVSVPQPSYLKQVKNIVMPIGSVPNDYYASILFDVVYTDGTTHRINMASGVEIIEVDGVNVSAFDTSVSGLHTAKLAYKDKSSSLAVNGDFVYSVELAAIESYYDFDSASGTITGIKAASANRKMYVVPSTIGGKAVTAIGNGVFAGMTNLTTVYIPDSVKTIGARAFAGCTALQNVYYFAPQTEKTVSVDIDDILIIDEYREATTNITIGKNEAGKVIADYVLGQDYIVFPSVMKYQSTVSLDEIKESDRSKYAEDANIYGEFTLSFAFAEGQDIVSTLVQQLARYQGMVYLPAGDTYMELYTEVTRLLGADKVKTYSNNVLPEGVNPVTPAELNYMFLGLTYSAPVVTKKEGSAYVKTGAALTPVNDTIIVPSMLTDSKTYSYGIVGLQENVFAAGVGVETRIYLPESIAYVEGNSVAGLFANGIATGIITVYTDINNLLKPVDQFPTSVTSIGEEAFQGCSKLHIDFSSATGLETIGARAFQGCSSLTSVVFGEGSNLKVIGENAFADCGAIVNVDLGNTQVEEIGAFAFIYNDSLATLVLPATINEIGTSAFYMCKNLSNVTVEATAQITFIGYQAFYSCAFDKSVFDGASGVDANAFQNCGPKA